MPQLEIGAVMGEFSEKVFDIVRTVPRGYVATYGQVARMIGAPRSARYVGYALRANPAPGNNPDSIPCHRVVFKDGSICKGFEFGGPDEQRKLLAEEGVVFSDDNHVNMQVSAWNPEFDAQGRPADIDWDAELGEE